MTNESCECSICLDNIINKNNNCSVCNNGVCNNCYSKIIDRTYQPEIDISYNCPFCKTENFKKWKAVDNEIVVNYFTEKEYQQNEQIWQFRDIIYDKDADINRLKNIIINKNKEIKKNK